MSCLLFAPSLLALAAASDDLVDKEYCFALRRDDPAWVAVGPELANGLVPGAAAAMLDRERSIVVSVFLLPGADPLTIAHAVARHLERVAPHDDFEVDEPTAEPFLGRPAAHVRSRWTFGGTPGAGHDVVFVHADHVYVVNADAIALNPERAAEAADATLATFYRTTGRVKGRRATPAPPDTDLVGARVRGGVYESAATGLRVAPQGDWRVARGLEPALAARDADLTLVHRAPDLVVSIASRLAPLPPDPGDGREPAPATDPHAYDLLGVSTHFEPFTLADGTPLTLLAGHAEAGDRVVYVTVEVPTALEEECRATIQQALSSIGTLGAAPLATLRREISGATDPQALIGAWCGVRSGVYRDFACDVVWRKRGGSWRVDAIPEPDDETRTMVAREITTDAELRIDVDRWDRTDLRHAHAQWLAEEFDAFTGVRDVPEPRFLRIEGTRAAVADLVSEEHGWDGIALTALRKRQRVRVLVTGGTPELREEALGGFELPRTDVQGIRATEDRLESLRMGVAMVRPDRSWAGAQLPLYGGRFVSGNILQWRSALDQSLTIVSMSSWGSTFAPAYATVLARQFTQSLDAPRAESEGQFLGEPCRAFRVEASPAPVEMAVLSRGGITHLVIAYPGARPVYVADAERVLSFVD
ncbi:MAG: hypothetical protein AAGI22_24940 [Planctomycetota bacterium]